MNTSAKLLRFAMTALRDIDAGYPASEIAYPPFEQEENIPQASSLLKLVAAIAIHLAESRELNADDRAYMAGLLPDLDIPSPNDESLAQAKREECIKEIERWQPAHAECVRALGGVHRNENPYVKAAVRKYENGGSNSIEIDDTTMVFASDDGDGGAWVSAWLWVSNKDAGIQPWSHVLEDFRSKFQAFEQDPTTSQLIAELVTKIGNAAPKDLLDLFEEQRDELKSNIGALAANQCSDNPDEQESALCDAEAVLEEFLDESPTTDVAILLYCMGDDGSRVIHEKIKNRVRTPIQYDVCAYSDLGEQVIATFKSRDDADRYGDLRSNEMHIEVRICYDDGSRD